MSDYTDGYAAGLAHKDRLLRERLKDAEREAITAWYDGKRPPTPVHDAEAIAELMSDPP